MADMKTGVAVPSRDNCSRHPSFSRVSRVSRFIVFPFKPGNPAAESIYNVKSAISDQAKRGASALRFVDELPPEELATLWSRLHSNDLPVEVNSRQRDLVLMEKAVAYAAKPKRK